MNEPARQIEELFLLLRTRGGESYFGEPVSQLEHALQAAWLASGSGAAPSLIAAALLHDVGHLLHNHPEDIAGAGIDTLHEQARAEWLRERFGPAVSEPVRLHVAAKRYLCFANPEYFANLSPASVESLALQGGPMPAGEAREFEKNPWFGHAVQLRRWDEAAKLPGLEVPDLDSYRALLESLLQEVPAPE